MVESFNNSYLEDAGEQSETNASVDFCKAAVIYISQSKGSFGHFRSLHCSFFTLCLDLIMAKWS